MWRARTRVENCEQLPQARAGRLTPSVVNAYEEDRLRDHDQLGSTYKECQGQRRDETAWMTGASKSAARITCFELCNMYFFHDASLLKLEAAFQELLSVRGIVEDALNARCWTLLN